MGTGCLEWGGVPAPETRPFSVLPFPEGLEFAETGSMQAKSRLSRWGGGHGLIYPQPGSDVIAHSALPIGGRGFSLWGYRPYTQPDTLADPQVLRGAPGGPQMAPRPGGVPVRKGGLARRAGGGAGCV